MDASSMSFAPEFLHIRAREAGRACVATDSMRAITVLAHHHGTGEVLRG
jgi:hypothetical protein